MGRIKIVAVKNLGEELIKSHGDRFSTDFERNKVSLDEFMEIKSKRMRNILAGYITGEMQKIKKSGI
jgi:small subunit ribosomal protein S17e